MLYTYRWGSELCFKYTITGDTISLWWAAAHSPFPSTSRERHLGSRVKGFVGLIADKLSPRGLWRPFITFGAKSGLSDFEKAIDSLYIVECSQRGAITWLIFCRSFSGFVLTSSSKQPRALRRKMFISN